MIGVSMRVTPIQFEGTLKCLQRPVSLIETFSESCFCCKQSGTFREHLETVLDGGFGFLRSLD